MNNSDLKTVFTKLSSSEIKKTEGGVIFRISNPYLASKVSAIIRNNSNNDNPSSAIKSSESDIIATED